jgi:hypothetical protein
LDRRSSRSVAKTIGSGDLPPSPRVPIQFVSNLGESITRRHFVGCGYCGAFFRDRRFPCGSTWWRSKARGWLRGGPGLRVRNNLKMAMQHTHPTDPRYDACFIGGKLYSLHAYPARSRHSGMSSDEPPDSLHVSLSNVTEPSRENQNRPTDHGDQRSAKMLPHCYQNPTASAALSFTSFP